MQDCKKKKSVNEKKVRKESECEVRWEKVTGWGGGIIYGRRTEVEKDHAFVKQHRSNYISFHSSP